MADISTLTEKKSSIKQREVLRPEIIGIATLTKKSPIQIVVDKKKTGTPHQYKSSSQENLPLVQVNLIKLTEKLAEDAKSGKLKGLGGFADYENGYMVGLEGSYLVDIGAAAKPFLHLQRRIMNQIESEE